MVEPLMFFGLGFLIASLIAFVTIPFVHNRAVRLTIRRIEASTPLSMAEIQADKDQLRAEFAMSTRRLEMSVEQMKTKTTGQLAELGKKTDTINHLKLELGDKAATIFSLEAREKALKDQLRATEDELSVKTGALQNMERTLADKEAALIKLTAEFDQQAVDADSQRVEIVALKTQVASLKDQVSELESDVQETTGRLARERSDAEDTTKKLAAERGQVEKLGIRIAQLERELAAQVAEVEILGRRIAELEARLADQGRLLADRERERDQLRLDIEAARRIEGDLRQELAIIDRRHASAQENLKAEKLLAEAQLERAREERSKLQRELASIKHDTEAAWAAERMENALLRERINDVAAEVVHLTAALEGPGSPIDNILAQDAGGANAQRNGQAKQAGGEQPSGSEQSGSLADRIRALQGRASRLSSAT